MSRKPIARGRDEVMQVLVDAAKAMLTDCPPDEVTTKAIALAAGVNHGQIHHYFGSKDDLIAAAVEGEAQQTSARALAAGGRFPLPIETSVRPPLWRTLLYLASSGAWSRPPYRNSPVVGALVQVRAAQLRRPTNDVDVLADVAATVALQRGWWFFQGLIEVSLGRYRTKKRPLRADIAALSMHLVDRSIRTPSIARPRADWRAPVAAVPRPSRAQGRDEVRAALLASAAVCLQDRSPAHVTTKEIARLAAVNHGQIHHYFDSKDMLVAKVLDLEAQQFLDSAMDGSRRFPLPIDTEHRPRMWRTLAHLAMTEEWANPVYGKSPVIASMVEVLADRLGTTSLDPMVHAQVAATHALELGWAAYRDIIESSLAPFDADLQAVREGVEVRSMRLVDPRALDRRAIRGR